MENTTKPTFAFFGTPQIAVYALEAMEKEGFVPSLVVSNPDAPVGRKHTLTPPPTKVWAQSKNISIFQPTTLKQPELLIPLTSAQFDFFVVFAYGKIIPPHLLFLPRFKTINAHPSLLPKLRGASPIRSALLHDLSAVGVTIIEMDEELDHGPILLQEKVELVSPIPGGELDMKLGARCGALLVEAMKGLRDGTLTSTAQNHDEATFCGKIEKSMSELRLDPKNLPTGKEAEEVYRKICAFDGWPGTFFMHEGKRIKIVSARLENNALTIEQIVPEGKKVVSFSVWTKN
jgi:methionyl-tRNA formyltransferase